MSQRTEVRSVTYHNPVRSVTYRFLAVHRVHPLLAILLRQRLKSVDHSRPRQARHTDKNKHFIVILIHTRFDKKITRFKTQTVTGTIKLSIDGGRWKFKFMFIIEWLAGLHLARRTLLGKAKEFCFKDWAAVKFSMNTWHTLCAIIHDSKEGGIANLLVPITAHQDGPLTMLNIDFPCRWSPVKSF